MKVCGVIGKREAIVINNRIILSSAVVLSAWFLTPGCSSKDGGDSGTLGSAQAAVTNVPSDGTVACIAITSTGSWASTQSFDVTPGESTVFTLDGIPTGTVRFDSAAYPTACALVTPSSVPTWASLPVLATVTEGQTTMVTLDLQQAGGGAVGVGFMPPPSCRSEGQPCLAGGECCSGTCGADDTCAPSADPCSGGTCASTYVIPGTGGISGGGYLELDSANGDVSLNLTCNYGFAGDDEAFFSAGTPSVTAGSVKVTVDIQGDPEETFDDLSFGSGGQDRAFASTFDQGTWPWQGVFTVNEGGTPTQWTVTMNGSATGDCTAIVSAIGGGTATVHHP